MFLRHTRSTLLSRVPVHGGVKKAFLSTATSGGNPIALAAGAAALAAVSYAGYKAFGEEQIGSSAFVFVKPHAVTDPVKALVKKEFEAAGISVVGEGVIDGRTIDEKMYIDNHYGAIAAKAVKMKPTELAPSAKAKAAFAEAFGLTWEAALAKGVVYNAMDGCKKLRCDGDALDGKWAKLTRGKDLIKFGGGFYCGKVDGIYIINGFYMSMRGNFTKPTASIAYYLVEWPTKKLAWEDFRGKVLGATDPKTAAPGSLRRSIYNDWKALGLAAVPNTGDNGVHASASPFEALAERMNWCGATVETDAFGKAMLAKGISKATILAWCEDPQVKLPEGGQGSLFDALEDLSADVCLAKAAAIDKANK